jgi:hypothetical protein
MASTPTRVDRSHVRHAGIILYLWTHRSARKHVARHLFRLQAHQAYCRRRRRPRYRHPHRQPLWPGGICARRSRGGAGAARTAAASPPYLRRAAALPSGVGRTARADLEEVGSSWRSRGGRAAAERASWARCFCCCWVSGWAAAAPRAGRGVRAARSGRCCAGRAPRAGAPSWAPTTRSGERRTVASLHRHRTQLTPHSTDSAQLTPHSPRDPLAQARGGAGGWAGGDAAPRRRPTSDRASGRRGGRHGGWGAYAKASRCIVAAPPWGSVLG